MMNTHPEFSDSDVIIRYFFTVTLSKDLLLTPVKTQLLRSYGPLYRTCKQIFNHFELVYEFTKTCNIHYHGMSMVFKGDEHLIYCFQDLLKGSQFGFSKIDEIKKDNGVSDYLIKSMKTTERICNRLKIDLDHYPILVNQESIIRKERFKIKPLKVIQTTKLDLLPPIYEVSADDDLEDERQYIAFNCQLK